MKKILFILLIISVLSCTNSDDTNNTVNETSEFTDTLPLNIGNYWTYNVIGTTTTRDSLYISNDTVIASNTYKKFKTKNNIATGFYSSSLANNAVRKSFGKLLLSGDFSFGQTQTLPVGLDLNLSDFIIFKEYALPGEILSEKSGTFEQDFNGIPLTVSYRLYAVGGENFSNYTSQSINYTTVKSTKIILNLKIISTQTVAGISIPITILPQQDVVTSTQYLAKNLGVIYTNTFTSYNLDATIATQLGIPATTSQTQEEFLDTFNVN